MGKDILLVDFDMLMNYDFAILNTYRIINNLEPLKPDAESYTLLENRENDNVLCEVIDNIDNASKIREDIINNHTDIIYQNLIANVNIFNVVNACQHDDMVDVTICCKTQIEEQIVKQLFGYKTILDDDVKPGIFDTFMVHHNSRVVSNLKRYIGKSVYIAMVRYNLNKINDQLVLPLDFINLIADRVNVRMISLFNNKK